MSARLGNTRRPSTLRLSAFGAALAGLVVAGLPATPVQSAAPASECPEAFPIDEVEDGMAVDGLTVTKGSVPEAFTGEVLGVLDDGIAPGVDMIMVRLQGAQITDADGEVDKGIWSGMSGSPVYTEDGRLLGAVAYGLSWSPSDVAGVTPAAQMLDLVSDGGPAPARQEVRGARRVDISATGARSAGLTRQQARGGFERLPMPFSMSGFSSQELQKVAETFGIKRPLVAGSAATAAEPATPITAGGNLVAALSYGDITFAGIGTATAVCGDEVVGFGHPLLWSGRATYSMHNANTIYIQRDNVFGSFKVANPTAPLGGIVEDRLTGIVGVTGELPPATEVTSHVESPTDSRDGETVITYRKAIPALAATHLLANALRMVDKRGAGTANVTWTAEGTRADGTTWEFSRTNTFASRRDISFFSALESYQMLSRILRNNFERVSVSDVHYEASFLPRYEALDLTKLELRKAGEWVAVGRRNNDLSVKAGSTLQLRVSLTPSQPDAPVQQVRLALDVPDKGRYGFVRIGADSSSRRLNVSSFDDLLDSLGNAPANNTLVATLETEGRRGGGVTTSDEISLSEVVSGRRYLELRIRN